MTGGWGLTVAYFALRTMWTTPKSNGINNQECVIPILMSPFFFFRNVANSSKFLTQLTT